MSLSEDEPRLFLGPLTGKTTTFMLEGRQANLGFAAMVMGLVSRAGRSCAVFDLDAFYSSNADRVMARLDPAGARSMIMRIPEPGSDVELELSKLFETGQDVLVVDSLNTLYHLTSLEDGASRNRKLAFALASLSYFARAGRKAVILSMYRREGLFQAGTGRPISSLSDSTASVEVGDGEVNVTVERGSVWPGGAFLSRSP